MTWYPFGNLLDDIMSGPPGPPGHGFKLTNDGNYDMQNKILKNCKTPRDLKDSTTKEYVDKLIVNVNNAIKEAKK